MEQFSKASKRQLKDGQSVILSVESDGTTFNMAKGFVKKFSKRTIVDCDEVMHSLYQKGDRFLSIYKDGDFFISSSLWRGSPEINGKCISRISFA